MFFRHKKKKKQSRYDNVAITSYDFAGITQENITGVSFNVVYDGIQEFEGTDLASGTKVGEYFQIRGFQDVSLTSSNNIYNATLTSSDGIFSVSCYFASNDTTIDSVEVGTKNTKCSISINNFPFNSTTSKLALNVYVVSASVSLGYTSASSEAETGMIFADGKAHFTWTPTAFAGSESIQVSASSLQQANGTNFGSQVVQLGFSVNQVWYSFQTSGSNRNIYWDPEYGSGKGPVSTSLLQYSRAASIAQR